MKKFFKFVLPLVAFLLPAVALAQALDNTVDYLKVNKSTAFMGNVVANQNVTIVGNANFIGGTVNNGNSVATGNTTRNQNDTVLGNFAVAGYANHGEMLFLTAVTAGPVTLSGASTTLLSIPAGSLVLACVSRVTTTITGATTWKLGDTVATSTGYGATIALTSGTTSGPTGYTVTGPLWYTAATNLTATANGSNFTGGAVRATCLYWAVVPPTN